MPGSSLKVSSIKLKNLTRTAAAAGPPPTPPLGFGDLVIEFAENRGELCRELGGIWTVATASCKFPTGVNSNATCAAAFGTGWTWRNNACIPPVDVLGSCRSFAQRNNDGAERVIPDGRVHVRHSRRGFGRGMIGREEAPMYNHQTYSTFYQCNNGNWHQFERTSSGMVLTGHDYPTQEIDY